MNTKNKLNCYTISNLIVSVLSLNLLVNPTSSVLVSANNETGTLNKIYEKEVPVVVNEVVSDTTTIVVSSKEVQSKNTNTNTITYVKPTYNRVTGESLVNYAKHYLGLKYVSGGNSLTTGTDCSGFTKLIFKEFGINLGRTVSSQIYSGTYVSKSDLEPGDLVFYGHSSSKATHVGIYIGSGLVIHESKPGDVVKINSVNMMVYITARRLITKDIQKEVVIESKKEEIKEEKVEEVIDEVKDIKIENSKEENQKFKDESSENKIEKDEKIDVEVKEENNLTKEDVLDSTNEEKKVEEIKVPDKEESKTIEEETSCDENNTKEEKNNLELKDEKSLENKEVVDTEENISE